MALPMQLRIKATSERLRTNHIDLLEYTEKLSQENETLKNRMEQVMRNASLSTSSLPFEDHEPVEDAEKRRLLNEIENLKMEVETLSKKLMSSEIDKKTLKAKAQLSQPNNDERLSNLRSRLEEETRLKLECSEHILALQEETCKLRQENDFLRQEMSEVVEEAKQVQEKSRNAMELKEQETAALDTKLKQIIEEMDGMSDYHSQCMDSMMKSFRQEMEKKLLAEHEIQDKQLVQINYLTEELNIFKGAMEANKPSSSAKRGIIESDEDILIMPMVKELCPKCKDNINTTIQDGKNVENAEIKADFPEYVRVLEENRVLKIQLAEATSTSFTSSSKVSKKPPLSAGSGRPRSSRTNSGSIRGVKS